MFGIKGRDTFNRPESSVEKIFSWVRRKWTRIFPFLLGAIFVLIMGVVVYMWYMYVHTKELTGEEKTQYVNQKKAEVVFRREKFDQLKGMIEKRTERFNAERVQYTDIFYR